MKMAQFQSIHIFQKKVDIDKTVPNEDCNILFWNCKYLFNLSLQILNENIKNCLNFPMKRAKFATKIAIKYKKEPKKCAVKFLDW